ncbi:MAG: YncE family protein [Gemmatimonadaceae bacterium]
MLFSIFALLAHVVVTIPRAPACYATAASMTPPSWRAPAPRAQSPPKAGFRLVREIPLPGPANRFDYQSVDPTTRRLYINHMDAGQTLVFDLDANRVVTAIAGVPRATGVWAVPSHHQVYVSAPGAHQVAIIDDRSLGVTAHVNGVGFPDGIAYAPGADKVFVSDESRGTDIVIDPNTEEKRSTIPLGGEAGNTHYDSVSHCILVAVQTRDQLVAIDPVAEKIVARYDLPGSGTPHGFTIDEDGRLAFISSEGNATLLVLDLRTMKILQLLKVPDDPDVLAWDAAWRRLYVAAESGVVSAYWLDGRKLRPIGEIRAPHAHTVSVDPKTHMIYLPLENVAGRPLLRILEPLR